MSTLSLLRRLYGAGQDDGVDEDGRVPISSNQPPPELVARLWERTPVMVVRLQGHRVGGLDEKLDWNEYRFVRWNDRLAPNACACLGLCANFWRRIPM